MTSNVDSAPQPAGDPGTLDGLLAVTPAGIAPDTYVGAGHDYGPLRIYGGHLLGQGLAAAFATVPGDKLAHSLHAYFLKTGAPDQPIAYQVERLRDGRMYTTRSVRAVQDGRVLMALTASFKSPETGDEHAPVMPESPDPDAMRAAGEPLAMPFTGVAGVELLSVTAWHPRLDEGSAPAIRLWTRAAMFAGAGPRAAQCALAYLSDGTLMFNALRPHGRAFVTHRATSLDHAVWFHGPADPGDWLLFDQSGPVAADARGLNHGRLFSRDGRSAVSVVQESMMRRV